jgi:tripartite-type tricarboxylate transporter receptor subunit TctC
MARERLRRVAVAIAALLVILGTMNVAAHGAELPSFKGKTITMIIGDPPGGGTDLTGRLFASYFSKYLPGQPVVIVRNMPGGGGITSMNYMATQTKPDGLSVTMGATSQVDPKNYRQANAQYDPAKFLYIGGVVRGGYGLVMGVDAARRLHDKSRPPVIIGTATGNPRNAMQMAMWGIEYLGWNAKWVTGYPGTNDLMMALERGEIDATTTGNMVAISSQISDGKFEILAQTGNSEGDKVLPRPDFGAAPVFADLMRGKLTDPTAESAFRYWLGINGVDKFAALMPGTPPEIVAAYRDAFNKLAADPDFIAKGKIFSDDFVPTPARDIEHRISTLAHTSSQAIDYITGLLRKQGLNVE